MLQNARKTLGFKQNMVFKILPGGGGGGGGKPFPASGLFGLFVDLVLHKTVRKSCIQCNGI